MSFLLSLFLLSWFSARLLVTSTVLGFLHVQLPLQEILPSWASAVLGLRFTGTKVVSARLNLSHGPRDVGGPCNFLSSVSPQQRFEMVDQCYSLITAQFYLESKI